VLHCNHALADPASHGDRGAFLAKIGLDPLLEDSFSTVQATDACKDACKEMSKLCMVRNATQIMVCDVSRDTVKRAASKQFGKTVTFETVPGEGTLFSCLDVSRTTEFQQSVSDALRWMGKKWATA
jgi:hypothetical protein